VGDFDNVGFNRQTLGNLLDPGGFFKNTPQQPGVGGINQDNHRLVRDPTTGMFYDPQSGTSYADADGLQPVTDPNVAQQVAANFNRSTSFLNQLGQVQGQQQGLATNLQQVIGGHGPSLAGMQTSNALDQIARDQMSQAAGVSGAASPLAHLLAMRNTGTAQIGATNAGAMARVAEQAHARDSLSALLGGMAGTDATVAGGLAGLANTGQMGQQGLNQSTDQANQKKNTQLGASLISAFA
jgi:hypothetical protein